MKIINVKFKKLTDKAVGLYEATVTAEINNHRFDIENIEFSLIDNTSVGIILPLVVPKSANAVTSEYKAFLNNEMEQARFAKEIKEIFVKKFLNKKPSKSENTAVAIIKATSTSRKDKNLLNKSNEELLKKDISTMEINELLEFSRVLVATFMEPKAVSIDNDLMKNAKKLSKANKNFAFDNLKVDGNAVFFAKEILKLNILNMMNHLRWDLNSEN